MKTTTKAAAALTTAVGALMAYKIWTLPVPKAPAINIKTVPQADYTGAFNRTTCPNGAQTQPNGLCPPHYDWYKQQGFYPPQPR